ncbi:response regulator [Arenibacter sp. TNZ]|jgi:CheY-like chemotaxis protein|uniref:response regulator n=1 Tax=Arenibacter TaxID=178469 RepID=UPI000CD3D1C3|nr:MULTISPECIES: response regulator [Arenibacter]MCM4173761.1 response regulator [Arenibacter sp. TNZ]
MNSSLNVCIVDDDDIYQFTVIKTLKALKLTDRIMVFSDGEEALDFMLDHLNEDDVLPDVIFLDIDMPVMDGFQFMEEYIKLKPSLGKKIIIYMVSSSVDPADIERANKIGEITDYIVKPITHDQLKSIIQELESNGRL